MNTNAEPEHAPADAQEPPWVELLTRIANYLGNGGLFNPEYMEHDKVRDLIMDCRAALQHTASLAQENERLRRGWAANARDLEQRIDDLVKINGRIQEKAVADKATLAQERDALREQLESTFKGVLSIRCTRHIAVRQLNTTEHSGGECGACIAEERDRLRAALEAARSIVGFCAKTWHNDPSAESAFSQINVALLSAPDAPKEAS
jgi:hypothetical protein